MVKKVAGQRTSDGRVRTLLRERGLRFSRPRATIMGFFLAGDRHISAEGLHRSLLEDGASLSLSTVYLNLSVLCDAGLIRELKGLDGVTLYDSTVTPHSHLMCTVTGDVIDVPDIVRNGDTPLVSSGGNFLECRFNDLDNRKCFRMQSRVGVLDAFGNVGGDLVVGSQFIEHDAHFE